MTGDADCVRFQPQIVLLCEGREPRSAVYAIRCRWRADAHRRRPLDYQVDLYLDLSSAKQLNVTNRYGHSW